MTKSSLLWEVGQNFVADRLLTKFVSELVYFLTTAQRKIQNGHKRAPGQLPEDVQPDALVRRKRSVGRGLPTCEQRIFHGCEKVESPHTVGIFNKSPKSPTIPARKSALGWATPPPAVSVA